MADAYEIKLTKFLYKYNNLKAYFISWVPNNYEEIKLLDKSNFHLCIENDEIVGCLGSYKSTEQRILRLLGPLIIHDYFDKYVDPLFEQCMKTVQSDMNEMRVAFLAENKPCKEWCEKNEFTNYNAEKTIIYDGDLFEEDYPSSISLTPYQSTYKEGLALVHPKGTFFTLEELINQINDHNRLLLLVDQDGVAGYIYYEITKGKKQGEIGLLHVKEDKRSKGYGTSLLKKAINDLINIQVEEISASVRVNNYRAQELYKRIGFIDGETIFAYKKRIAN